MPSSTACYHGFRKAAPEGAVMCFCANSSAGTRVATGSWHTAHTAHVPPGPGGTDGYL